MARKLRQLISDLKQAGFEQKKKSGKGSHRRFYHPKYSGAVTLSGGDGDDAKPYQEKQVNRVIEMVTK